MDFNTIAAAVALVVSLTSIGALVFASGRFVEAVEGLRSVVVELKQMVKEVTRDLRNVERFQSRADERLSDHDRRIGRIEEEV